MKNTTVGVDLAKEVIQVCIYTNNKVQSNTEMTHHEFLAGYLKVNPHLSYLNHVVYLITGNKKLLPLGTKPS
jgi:hypothetical protein